MKCYLDVQTEVITYRDTAKEWEYEIAESVETIENMAYEKVIELINNYVNKILWKNN